MFLRLDCGTAGTAFGQQEYSQRELPEINKSAITAFAEWSRSNAHRTMYFCDKSRVSNHSLLKISLPQSKTCQYLSCFLLPAMVKIFMASVKWPKAPHIFPFLTQDCAKKALKFFSLFFMKLCKKIKIDN